MTPQEKAEEMFNKFYDILPQWVNLVDAKQCALLAVDEIIKAIDFDWMEIQNLESEHRYWDKVKIEILLL